jgi:hypothetical protein
MSGSNVGISRNPVSQSTNPPQQSGASEFLALANSKKESSQVAQEQEPGEYANKQFADGASLVTGPGVVRALLWFVEGIGENTRNAHQRRQQIINSAREQRSENEGDTTREEGIPGRSGGLTCSGFVEQEESYSESSGIRTIQASTTVNAKSSDPSIQPLRTTAMLQFYHLQSDQPVAISNIQTETGVAEATVSDIMFTRGIREFIAPGGAGECIFSTAGGTITVLTPEKFDYTNTILVTP